jgi:hypothetical protein
VELLLLEQFEKGLLDTPPRLLQLKKTNRGLIWGAMQASIIGGVYCWLWQDSNAVMGKFFIFYFSLFEICSTISRFKFLKKISSKRTNN